MGLFIFSKKSPTLNIFIMTITLGLLLVLTYEGLAIAGIFDLYVAYPK